LTADAKQRGDLCNPHEVVRHAMTLMLTVVAGKDKVTTDNI
jgi:hypothetical protein